MKPVDRISAVGAPLDMANIDTDQIIPARFLRRERNPSYGPYLFHDLRFDEQGRERAAFILNETPYRRAGILVAGENFGCGSSREGAVYALQDFGIQAVIAPSFGDIHYGNQIQNGMLPVRLSLDACKAICEGLIRRPGSEICIDLVSRTVVGPDGEEWDFQMNDAYRDRLLNGLDDIDLVLQHIKQIERFEFDYRTRNPWLA